MEGWGLHCETLGEELGLYQKPEYKMGQLSMEALRSGRLVVDTGMHALGWSFDRALQFMMDNTAMGKHDAFTEVARYVTWPGQATAYKVGERFIRKLRTMAETELGEEKFDPRDFYDIVLKVGAIPLDTLERLVKEYIQATLEKGAKSEAVVSDADEFLNQMTFASWCKCCIVPGACRPPEST